MISWAISVARILLSSDHLWMVYHDLNAASRTAFSSFLRVSTCSMKSWNRKTISLVAWLAYEDIIWWWSRPTTGSVPESINAMTNCSADTTPRIAGSLDGSTRLHNKWPNDCSQEIPRLLQGPLWRTSKLCKDPFWRVVTSHQVYK